MYDPMPNKVSLCFIKIEIDSEQLEDFGAVSAEHPTNPRVQKERERDRGLRNSTKIVIETYTNKFWSETEGDIIKMPKKTNEKNSKQSSTISPREITPLDENQTTAEFPTELTFFSGNPSVEVTNGIIHLYKKNERKEIKDGPSNQLCLLAVPSSLNCHDLLNFVLPCHSEIQHIRIVRDINPNQFMVLLKFRTNKSALDFYQSYNGAAYNSLEPDSVCHAVWVSAVEKADDGIAPLGHTELPTCPVCLERMDESVDGVLTILCNHAFHASCLVKWGDSTCPVCRHVQTPEFLDNSVCMECEGTDSLWICLICGHVGCGRYQGGHAAAHYRATNHAFALQLGSSSVWDYAGDNFVHRLFQNKPDGKLVATHAPNNEGEEKIDSMQLEFTYLLTSQLDTQRKYYEQKFESLEKELSKCQNENKGKMERTVELEDKVNKLSKEKQSIERKLLQNTNKLKEFQKKLNEENQFSKALQANQDSWQTKYDNLQKEYKEFRESQDGELKSLKEQLRDIMFHMEAQTTQVIAGGSVMGMEEPPPSRNNRRKKRY